MRALSELTEGNASDAWNDFVGGARQMEAELRGWEDSLEQQFRELEFFQAELERQAEATGAMQAQLGERQRQLEEERAATARLTHQLDQQEAQLREALGDLKQVTEELREERGAAQKREETLKKEQAKREAEWRRERDELRAQLAVAANTLPPATAAAPAFTAEIEASLTQLFASEFERLREEQRTREAALRQEFLEREAAWQSERQQLTAQLAAREAAAAVPAAAPDDELRELFAELLTTELKAERESQRAREDALRTEQAEREAKWQAERDELRAQLAVGANTLPPPTAAAPALEQALQTQIAELQAERTLLESELTLLRTRTADLLEQATEQKRLLGERQEELTGELKQLRELLAAHAWAPHPAEAEAELEAAAVSPAAAAPAMTQAAPPLPAKQAAKTGAEKPPDPLVDSVMAQFARLQKDVAQRRKQK